MYKPGRVGNMSEAVYLERMNNIASRRKDLQKEPVKAREQGNLNNLKNVYLNAIAEPLKKFLGCYRMNISFLRYVR